MNLLKAARLSINQHRLQFDNRERYPLEWLFKVQGMTYSSNFDMIKRVILCMDINHENYKTLSDEEKERADKLIENEDVVNIVLVTLFQWFGTNVGKHDIGKLIDEIRALEYKEPVKQ